MHTLLEPKNGLALKGVGVGPKSAAACLTQNRVGMALE